MKSTEYIYHHPEIYVTSRFPSAGKPFYPGGTDLSVRTFQDILKALSGKTRIALDLIARYGLAERVRLGKDPILDLKARADYLYHQSIHPRFFVEALHLIGRNARALDPQVSQINLRKLGRDNIESALTAGTITHRDLGRHFELFGLRDKTDRDKLEIMVRLGVIKFGPERSLNDVFPAATRQTTLPVAAAIIEPRPPIVKIYPERPAPLAKAADKKGQLILPGVAVNVKK